MEKETPSKLFVVFRSRFLIIIKFLFFFFFFFFFFSFRMYVRLCLSMNMNLNMFNKFYHGYLTCITIFARFIMVNNFIA
ncbi:hypothetical protein ACMBCN_03510 [Candidatus Liberibacter asiaticus]|nr:hypothetical protein [Candidatus Liberibacter asiaticus]